MSDPVPVPIVEINPADPSDVNMAFVPLSDLDDFLENLADDYELGFGELGGITGKGKLKVKLPAPKVSAKGKVVVKVAAGKQVSKPAKLQLKAVRPAIKVKAAAKLSAALPKTKGGAALAKVVKKQISKAKAAAKVGAKLAAKAKAKIAPRLVAKGLPKAAAKVALVKARAMKDRRAAINRTAKRHVIRAAAKLAPGAKKVVKVSAGTFAPVPLSTRALRHKAAAKVTAARIVSLAPSAANMKAKARLAVAAAMRGMPLRPKGISKPARAAVQAIRGDNVRCCIVARAKSSGHKTGGLQAKYKQQRKFKRAGPMPKYKFRAVVQGLLTKIERINTSPKLAPKIQQIKQAAAG